MERRADVILRMALQHPAVAVGIAFDFRLSLSASGSVYSTVVDADGRSVER